MMTAAKPPTRRQGPEILFVKADMVITRGAPMSDDGWIPRGFDATPNIIAAWKKQRDDYYAAILAGSTGMRLVILPPYIEIFTAAKRLLQAGEFAAAVILAQTACEVLSANFLARLVKMRGIDFLSDWILGTTRRSSNFSNELVRDLYVSLSGDRIHEQSFWQRYKAQVDLRNAIVHQGKTVTRVDAEESFEVVTEFIGHLEQVVVERRL
jgi:hypothetical protein